MQFDQMGLIAPLQKALSEEGYTQPTPIQAQAIPALLQGKDLLGCAQTGTGKTAAFSLPILQLLFNAGKPEGKRPIRALILTPTRELAIQIEESLRAYGRHLPLRHLVIFGGVGQQPQVDGLRKGIDILVATPGRLLDLMQQGYVHLDQLQIFVLDEADRMLDMGFVHDVKKVIAKLPTKRQTLLFSATMPAEIAELAQSILHQPVKVEVTPVSSTADTVQQQLFYVSKTNKRHLLLHLLQQRSDIDRLLVFNRTKHGANRIVKDLVKAGQSAEAIHGNKSQNARQQALQNFKAGKTRVLVATDIAARGIDIDDLGFVLNYDLPNIPETYVHRIGRTGRAGASGWAYSFCEMEERPYLRDIQKLIGKKIAVEENHPFVEVPGAVSHTEQEKTIVAHMHKAAQPHESRRQPQRQKHRGPKQERQQQQAKNDNRQNPKKETDRQHPPVIDLLPGEKMASFTLSKPSQNGEPRRQNRTQQQPQQRQPKQNSNQQPRQQEPPVRYDANGRKIRPNKPELEMPKPNPVANTFSKESGKQSKVEPKKLFDDDERW